MDPFPELDVQERDAEEHSFTILTFATNKISLSRYSVNISEHTLFGILETTP